MLKQLNSNEYAIYTVEHREPTEDRYLASKIYKDRYKLKRWLTALLADREVLMFWKEGDTRFEYVGTTKVIDIEGVRPLPGDFPVFKSQFEGKEVDEIRHISFYCIPGMETAVVDINDIEKFIVINTGLNQLTKKVLEEEANAK
jgi:hypothetical protein